MDIEPKYVDGEPVCDRYGCPSAHKSDIVNPFRCLGYGADSWVYSQDGYVCTPGIRRERDEARQLVYDLFLQSCTVPGKYPLQYDHLCMSVFEEAQESLIEWGTISAESCSRG